MKNIKIIIYSIVGLLLAGILFFLFAVAYSSFETFTAQTVQEKLDKAVIEETEWRQNYEAWTQIDQTFKEFKGKYFMKSQDFNDFKQQLQAIAGRNGVSTKDMKYNIKSLYKEVVRASFNTEITGAYDNIKRFIYELETNEKMVFFTKITLQKQQNGPRITGKISLEAYFVR